MICIGGAGGMRGLAVACAGGLWRSACGSEGRCGGGGWSMPISCVGQSGNIVSEGNDHQKQDTQDRADNRKAGDISEPSPPFVNLPVMVGRICKLAGKLAFQGRQCVDWIIPTLILRRLLRPDQVVRVS
jgi:hypothetical protein